MPKSDDNRSYLTTKSKQSPERLRQFEFNDGGRAAAGITGGSGDCVVRAIAIATGKSYSEVYNALQNGLRHQIEIERRQGLEYGLPRQIKPKATPLTGLDQRVFAPYLTWLGWEFVHKPLGLDGKPLRLQPRLLPNGRLIVLVSRHLVGVIDGVLHDTYDSAAHGRRPVQGYFRVKTAPPAEPDRARVSTMRNSSHVTA
jgi:hypothetical protein